MSSSPRHFSASARMKCRGGVEPIADANIRLRKHRRADLESNKGHAVDGHPGAPRVLVNSLRARRVILAVYLALNIGNITADPTHVRHICENCDRAPSSRVEILSRERRDGP